MSDKSASDFIKGSPHLKDFLPFIERLNTETGIGSILIACGYIESLLGNIISAFLCDCRESKELIDGFNAPIGTFSARIKMSYALGLISEIEKNEIDILRKIRNACAHDFKTSLDDKNIKNLCDSLTFSIKGQNISPEGHIKLASVAIIGALVNRAQYVGRHKLVPKTWQV